MRSESLSNVSVLIAPQMAAKKLDLVDKINKIVNQIERSVRDLTQQIPEVVTQRVDGPPNGHNEAHEVESSERKCLNNWHEKFQIENSFIVVVAGLDKMNPKRSQYVTRRS